MIDTHCHINDPIYQNGVEEYIKDANAAGVKKLVVIGFDYASSLLAIKYARAYECVYAAIGIHPSEVNKMKDDDLKNLEAMIKETKVIAIGEIGLDYYWEKDEKQRELQKSLFIKQIELANKYNLPIIIHSRDAIEDTYNIVSTYRVKRCGIMHCFSSSIEMANKFIELGYLLGIGGTVTFKNAIKPKEVATLIPSNSYVLETDSPYLTPVPHRGEVNHSKYLGLIRDQIALLRGITPEQVKQETTNNFLRVFHL